MITAGTNKRSDPKDTYHFGSTLRFYSGCDPNKFHAAKGKENHGESTNKVMNTVGNMVNPEVMLVKLTALLTF